MNLNRPKQLVITTLQVAIENLQHAQQQVFTLGVAKTPETELVNAQGVLDDLNTAADMTEVAVHMQSQLMSRILAHHREKEAKNAEGRVPEEEERGAFGEKKGENPFQTIPVADQPGYMGSVVSDPSLGPLVSHNFEEGDRAQADPVGSLEGSAVGGGEVVPGAGGEPEAGGGGGVDVSEAEWQSALDAAKEIIRREKRGEDPRPGKE